VITVAVRWYLRYGLSYRDVEELLAERGIEVDHVTVYRWVQRFTPLFADAARPARHATGDRWFVDETYVTVAGRWRYLYRAVDQFGQVIDVLLAEQRDTAAARRFFTHALKHRPAPVEVTTDKAGPYLWVLDELVPAAAHLTEQYDTDRSRPRSAEGSTAPDAGAQTLPLGRPATPSCRTSAAATTNSPPTLHRRSAWRQRSANSPWPCDQLFLPTRHLPRHPERNSPGPARWLAAGARRWSGRYRHESGPGRRAGRGRTASPVPPSAPGSPTGRSSSTWSRAASSIPWL
jgi:hypothetical protein